MLCVSDTLDAAPAPHPAPAPSEVHFALLAEAARAENRPLRHEFDDTGGEIAF